MFSAILLFVFLLAVFLLIEKKEKPTIESETTVEPEPTKKKKWVTFEPRNSVLRVMLLNMLGIPAIATVNLSEQPKRRKKKIKE